MEQSRQDYYYYCFKGSLSKGLECGKDNRENNFIAQEHECVSCVHTHKSKKE